MASSVDAKLLRQTKFPPEFNQKVDMKKVNVEVMKKWIAGKISDILGNEDDVIIELCFNLLEGTRFPEIKVLQIQLTGFLDKDTPKFCKELWNLCLSAQSNPQGVPKELLEAKKMELIQEKIDAEKAAEEERQRKEREKARDVEIERLRQRERATRGRGRGGGRGGGPGRDYDRPNSRSPPRRNYSPRQDYRRPPSVRDVDTYIPPGRSDRRKDDRGRRKSRSVSRSPSHDLHSSMTPPRRRDSDTSRTRKRRRSPSPSRSPPRRHYRRGARDPPIRGEDRSRSKTRLKASRSRSPRRYRRRSPTPSSRSRSPLSRSKYRRRRDSPSKSRSRTRSNEGGRRRSGKAGRPRRSPSYDSYDERRYKRADVGKGRKSRDGRRLSRSRSPHRHRGPSSSRSRDKSVTPKKRARSRSASAEWKNRSMSPALPQKYRSRSPKQRDRSRSPGARRERKRRRSLERYAPAGRRRRNTSSVSSPVDKRRKRADSSDAEANTRDSPPALATKASDESMVDAPRESTPEKATATPTSTLTANEMREKLLKEKVRAMRRRSSEIAKDENSIDI